VSERKKGERERGRERDSVLCKCVICPAYALHSISIKITNLCRCNVVNDISVRLGIKKLF